MNYEIGATYKYPYSERKLILKRVSGCHEESLCNLVFHFECGHFCTDNVFVDLINCKTGVQNYQNTQLKLF